MRTHGIWVIKYSNLVLLIAADKLIPTSIENFVFIGI